MTTIWITVAFSYYMLTFQVKYFPGDFATNTIIMFAAEVPAPLLAAWLMSRYSINTVFIFFFVI